MKLDTTVIANDSLTLVGEKLGTPLELDPTAVLEAFTRGELDDDQLISTLILCCQTDLDKSKQAMALLDQYHRRGLLETSLFLAAKTDLRFLTFFSPPTHSAGTEENPSTMTALDQFSSGMFEAPAR